MNFVRRSLALVVLMPMLAIAGAPALKCNNAGNPSQPFWNAQYDKFVAEGMRAALRGDIENARVAISIAKDASEMSCLSQQSKGFVELRRTVGALEMNVLMRAVVGGIRASDYRASRIALREMEDMEDGEFLSLPQNFSLIKKTVDEGFVGAQFENLEKEFASGKVPVSDYWLREKKSCTQIIRYLSHITLPERCRKYFIKHQ